MIINGKKLAKEILVDLKKEFKKFKKVILAAVVIGNNPASFSFLKQKQKTAEKLGVELKIYKFPASISNKKVIAEIEKICQKKETKGLIVQLPLPRKFNQSEILKSIPAKKDVDALGEKPFNLAPAVEVIRFIFKKYKINYKNKKIALIGLGKLVSQPIYYWLKEKVPQSNISVIQKNVSKKEREKLIKTADILISGVGQANLVPAKWVKKGVVVIDFGYNFKKSKPYGDIEKKAASRARLFTPTPGGTGPILVGLIFKNLLNLIRKK